MNSMPAGKYYVGDLCYVMHGEWDEACGLFFEGAPDHGCNEGVFTLKDGRRFATFNTAYGDGCYFDQSNRKYGVDAGGIGCILVDAIDLSEETNFLTGGQVIDFPHDFVVYKQDGVITFGHINIDTDPDYEEEDEY